EFRAANSEQLFGAQTDDVESRPRAVTVPHREIDILSCEVHVMQHRRHAQINAGVGFGEATEAMHQPFGGKVRRGADREDARTLSLDRKSTRLNSSHSQISYAVFCLKKKKKKKKKKKIT